MPLISPSMPPASGVPVRNNVTGNGVYYPPWTWVEEGGQTRSMYFVMEQGCVLHTVPPRAISVLSPGCVRVRPALGSRGQTMTVLSGMSLGLTMVRSRVLPT